MTRIRNWYKKRKRAVCLGDLKPPRLWYDPVTGDIWQARSRWSVLLVTPAVNETVEDAIKMLGHVHHCDLYVEPEDYGVVL